MKLNKQQSKGISKKLKRYALEQSEYCVECLQETDISDLNLVTGVCTTCKCSTIKLTNELIEKLMGLYEKISKRS